MLHVEAKQALLRLVRHGRLAREQIAGRKAEIISLLSTTRLLTLFTRIRRSLKPKRLAFISGSLTPLVEHFASAQLNCELVLDDGRAFALDHSNPAEVTAAIARFQDVLAVPASR